MSPKLLQKYVARTNDSIIEFCGYVILFVVTSKHSQIDYFNLNHIYFKTINEKEWKGPGSVNKFKENLRNLEEKSNDGKFFNV